MPTPTPRLLSQPDPTALYGIPEGQSQSQNVVVKTQAYTLTLNDFVVLGDATNGAFPFLLPSAVGFTSLYFVRAINTNTNQITLTAKAGQTIDGAATVLLGTAASGAPYLAVTVASDGANWRIV